tara:strand:- start:558 stop:1796 length:1239 start_codon:yes stop_codon:yes gene_type:complete
MNNSRLLGFGSTWHISTLSGLYLSQGLSGGFTMGLTTYLVSKGASVSDISLLLSITLLPWTIKFLLGPFVDAFTLKRFGRRRFWILLSQTFMLLSLTPLVFTEVESVTTLLIVALTFHNFCVAISDISIDAMAADTLEEKDLGKANGFMWGSKMLGRGSGMALSALIFFNYGVNLGILVLILLMFLFFLMPIFSKELEYKIGSEEEGIVANKLPVRDLISEVLKGFSTKKAVLALFFMLFANIGYGIFDVVYNQFYIDTLGWSGEEIGSARPIGMWVGAVVGLMAGLLSVYLGKRYLLTFFILGQMGVFLALSTFTAEASYSSGLSILIGLDAFDAGWSVLIFAALMSLCTTKTSATNFGIYVGLANISTLIGNNLAPLMFSNFDYSVTFIFCAVSMIPCLIIAPLITKEVN